MHRIYHYKEYPFTIGDTLFTFVTDPPAIPPLSLPDEWPKGIPLLHSHQYCEIFFILNGQIKLHTETLTYELQEGDCIFIPSGYRHTSEYIGASGRFAIPFFYTRQNLESTSKKYYDTFENLFSQEILVFREFMGGDAFKRLAYYYYSNFPDKDELICTCCREIILLMKASLFSDAKTIPLQSLSDTDNYRNYIISNYFELSYKTGTLPELAQLLHLSSQQTQRLVKNLYGKTFRDHMLEKKMSVAKGLLQNTTLSATKIAEEVGYTYPHSFFSAFRKYYGTTPELYRKEHA